MTSAFAALTTRGRAFLAAGVASGVSALVVGQKDLLRVALLLVVLPVATVVLTQRARYLLTCSRLVHPTRVQAGQPAQVDLRLENPGRTPTGLMLLEDTIPYVLGSRPRFVIDQLRPKWHREMTYAVRSDVRGRYVLGPLTVRLSDPFGFVELSRSFAARTALVVTPVIHALPMTTLSGDWSGTGDNRPRAFAAAGTEDITVREYRLGDDLRRIHWRSTARTDELMVRREEQPHQSRVTVLLDTRAAAHRGSGPSSSFEYAVSAAASVGSHLAGNGFVVRMLVDTQGAADSTWHDRGISAPAEVEMLLESLAVIQLSNRGDFDITSSDYSAAGLVIAILGETTPSDVASLAGLKAGSTRALAILLDVAAWSRSDQAAPRIAANVDDQALVMRRQGWSVVVVRPGDKMATVWRDLARSRPSVFRPEVHATLQDEGPAA
ncbi:MAG: hypothetical protein QOI51_1436 [Nocardioidaceae bacterium]|jgi:uncharacterized protein (DUF58 family)|nr:hypothetical protein [Nocardioidaceae bacterium]MDX6308253.1 hypothetical protein [Nocardioidaceae bacterium]